MSATNIIDQLDRSLRATGELIAGIGAQQWQNPTPCPNWNVRQLLNHLVVGNGRFASIVRGEPLPSPEQMSEMQGVDVLGDNPLSAYDEAAIALRTAFEEPGVLDRVIQAPIGTVPGVVLLHLRMIELLVHGWDLAQATGQPANLPDDLAEQELFFARSPLAPNVPRTGHPFGPVQVTPDSASAIDRLAAYLGRPVLSGSAGIDSD